MKRWRTQEIMGILSGKDVFWTAATTSGAYGDSVSTRILLFLDDAGPDDPLNHEFVQVQGFSTADSVFVDPDDCKIEMIEVSDDSGHGLQSSDKGIGRIYADAVTALRKAGFVVVPRMDDYF